MPEEDNYIAEEALEEAMDCRDGFNPQAVGDEEFYEVLRITRARHAACIQFPSVFPRYWDVDELDIYLPDEYEDDYDLSDAGEPRIGAHP